MFLDFPNVANASTPSKKTSNMISAFTFLRAAKKAQEACKQERAQYFWLRAKSLYPSLPKPSWLLPEAISVVPVVPDAVNERQFLLDQSSQSSRTSQLTDTQIKSKLEALLKANPMDKEVRKSLLSIANRQADSAAVQRHQSVLHPLPKPTSSNYSKLALLAVILGAILLCAFAPLGKHKKVPTARCRELFVRFFQTIQSFMNK